MDNKFVQGVIEEALADKLPTNQFQRFLMDCLTSGITYKRGNAPDLVAILNDADQLQSIVDLYKGKFEAEK